MRHWIPSQGRIVLGDWNAKIDTANDGYEEALGRYGDRNDLGDRLLQYNALLIRGYTSAAENTEHLRPDIGSNTSLPPPPRIYALPSISPLHYDTNALTNLT